MWLSNNGWLCRHVLGRVHSAMGKQCLSRAQVTDPRYSPRAPTLAGHKQGQAVAGVAAESPKKSLSMKSASRQEQPALLPSLMSPGANTCHVYELTAMKKRLRLCRDFAHWAKRVHVAANSSRAVGRDLEFVAVVLISRSTNPGVWRSLSLDSCMFYFRLSYSPVPLLAGAAGRPGVPYRVGTPPWEHSLAPRPGTSILARNVLHAARDGDELALPFRWLAVH